MGLSPVWKVYSPKGKYIAACKYSDDAAAVVAQYGAGATIRWNHAQIMWHEGSEDFLAGESYARVAEVCRKRLKERFHREDAKHLQWAENAITKP